MGGEPPRLMVYAPTSDPEASSDFYRKLGFEVHLDEVDGTGVRCVRMRHPLLPAVLLNLRYAEQASPAAGGVKRTGHALFSVVDAGSFDWRGLVQKENLPIEHEVSLPAARWTYVRDPGGNLICITTSDLY